MYVKASLGDRLVIGLASAEFYDSAKEVVEEQLGQYLAGFFSTPTLMFHHLDGTFHLTPYGRLTLEYETTDKILPMILRNYAISKELKERIH